MKNTELLDRIKMKTPLEILDELSIQEGYKNWSDLANSTDVDLLNSIPQLAAKVYASQSPALNVVQVNEALEEIRQLKIWIPSAEHPLGYGLAYDQGVSDAERILNTALASANTQHQEAVKSGEHEILEYLIDELQHRKENTTTRSNLGRHIRGAYVDCIMMVKQYLANAANKPDNGKEGVE